MEARGGSGGGAYAAAGRRGAAASDCGGGGGGSGGGGSGGGGAAARAAVTASVAPTLSDRLNPTHPAFDAALKASWKTLPKAERAAAVAADAAAVAARHAAVADVAHPFEVDDADHCETAAEAYSHVAPFLAAVAAAAGKTPATLRIYDPYYCTGTVVAHLAALGYTNVYHRCEDFYAAVAARTTPDFDVLLTNPAYSGDHVGRLLAFAAAAGKPYFLLMPAYVATKPVFRASLGAAAARATYALYPRKRYVYWTPKGLRTKEQSHSSGLGSRTSPFISFWYLNFGPYDAAVRRWYATAPPAARGDAVFVTSLHALPRGMLDAGGGAPAAGVKRSRSDGGGGAEHASRRPRH